VRENDNVTKRKDWKGTVAHTGYMGVTPFERNGSLTQSKRYCWTEIL
jgi:hypothetical protein